MPRPAMAIISLGMLALMMAFFVPPIIDAQDNEIRNTVELEEGESVIVDEVVRLEMNTVDNANSLVNLTVRDVSTQSGVNVTNLSVNETKTVTPVDEPISVTLESIETGQRAEVTPEFSRTYGWNDGAAAFIAELDTIMTVVGFLAVAGGIAAVLNR